MQRGKEENKDRRRENGCVRVLACLCVIVYQNASTFIHAHAWLYNSACYKNQSQRSFCRERQIIGVGLLFLCPQIVFPAASDGKEFNIFTQLLHVCAV